MADITIAGELERLDNKRKELAANINEKGVPTEETETLTQLVPKVLDIPAGGSTEWQPHPDWWDIESMVNTGVLPWLTEPVANVRYGYVMTDSTVSTTFDAGYEYYTSDGGHYANGGTHTWDRAKDKDCSEGYGTRAVIVCRAANRSVVVRQDAQAYIPSLYVYLGDCNVTSMYFCYTTGSYPNRTIRAVVANDLTTGSGSVANFAFYSCTSLARVEIPEGVTSMGGNAFNNCSSLAEFKLPLSITSIGAGLFGSCRALRNAPFFDGMAEITNQMFANCSALTSITIPDSVTSVGSSAFNNCYALASVTIPDNVTVIADSAFASCPALTSITMPDSVTSVGSSAFNFCYALTSVIIPDGFNLPLTLSSSTNLSISSMENIIYNYADMTGETALTLTLGATNLAKLSDEIKAVATSKNITLA